MILDSRTNKSPAQVINQFGNCIEIIPTDKYFENISIEEVDTITSNNALLLFDKLIYMIYPDNYESLVPKN